jgi:hypothetical protein
VPVPAHGQPDHGEHQQQAQDVETGAACLPRKSDGHAVEDGNQRECFGMQPSPGDSQAEPEQRGMRQQGNPERVVRQGCRAEDRSGNHNQEQGDRKRQLAHHHTAPDSEPAENPVDPVGQRRVVD